MRSSVSAILILLSASAIADQVLDGLTATKTGCSNAQALLTFDSTTTASGGQEIHQRYQALWAIKGNNSIVTYLNDDGKPRANFLSVGQKDIYYIQPKGPKGIVDVDYEIGHSGTYNVLYFGLTAAENWYGDLLKSGEMHVISPDPTSDIVEIEGSLPSGVYCHAWLKKSLGYLATRSILKNANAQSDSETTVDQWEQHGKVFFPTHGIAIHHESLGKPHTVTMEIHVSNIELGDVNSSRFDVPTLIPGSQVKDDVNREMWQIGPNGEKLFRGTVGNAELTTSKPTMFGWLRVLAVSGLLTAAVLYARRTIDKR